MSGTIFQSTIHLREVDIVRFQMPNDAFCLMGGYILSITNKITYIQQA